MEIHRRCACGCGGITNYGKRYVHGHYFRGKKQSKEQKRKISIARKGMKFSKKHIKNMSLGKQSKEYKLKMSLSRMRSHPGDKYCEVWRDREYRKDLRKDYCENIKCKKVYKQLDNHHINLNKKDCRPFNVMTLCHGCHVSLHRKLTFGKNIVTNHKDYLTIIRKDRITYIHKKTRRKVAWIWRC